LIRGGEPGKKRASPLFILRKEIRNAMATGETITFDAGGRETAGYLARPDGGGNGAGVVVIHEWWGLNEHTKDIARRYADEGFIALAPDLYAGTVTRDPAEASALMKKLDADRALGVLNAAVDRLAATEGVEGGRVGVTGFCMGGSFALLLACRNPKIRAAAPFYGDIPEDEDIAKLSAPVLFIGASEDKWITPEKMAGLRESLDRHGKSGEVKVYEGADHAFFNDTRPEVHNPEAAADAWRRVLEFFRANV
jgi:carboxymethylenebutenolidase